MVKGLIVVFVVFVVGVLIGHAAHSVGAKKDSLSASEVSGRVHRLVYAKSSLVCRRGEK